MNNRWLTYEPFSESIDIPAEFRPANDKEHQKILRAASYIKSFSDEMALKCMPLVLLCFIPFMIQL